MSKKMAAIWMTVCLCIAQTGCAGRAESVTITTTFYPLYLAALNVTADVEGVAVSCMTPPQAGCLHDYQMTTADRRLLADSDVVVINGAGLEAFLDKLLPSLHAAVIDASEGVALLNENAHVWVSVSGMMAQVDNIVKGLSAADPAHAAQYERNGLAYLQKLSALNTEMEAMLKPVKGASIVTFHEAFDYFADEFGLTVAAVVETEAGSAPSPRALSEVVRIIQNEGVRALFAEPQYDDASVEILSRETGVPIYLLDPVVTGEATADNPDAYLDIMLQNARTLLEALK